GKVVPSQGSGQSTEMQATKVEVLGDADVEKYPIQPKKHSLEFLREKAHLRIRITTFGAVFRVRHALAFAVHRYINDKGLFYIHTQVITAYDAEGVDEYFNVTALDIKNLPLTENRDIDYKEDSFGRETNLTVSGQLER